MTTKLRQFIQQETPAMCRTLRGYLFRAGVSGDRLDDAASELWNEVVREALSHEARFADDLQPRPWLLGIAVNLMRRQQTAAVQRQQREPLARDLYQPQHEDTLSDDEVFERLAALTSMTDELDQEEAVNDLLQGLSPADQQILKLAVVQQLDGKALALAMAISPGAARVRLHRALERLRQQHAPDTGPNKENAHER
jgi:RNA polymerase sigma-70 factor (ECF subfamily)